MCIPLTKKGCKILRPKHQLRDPFLVNWQGDTTRLYIKKKNLTMLWALTVTLLIIYFMLLSNSAVLVVRSVRVDVQGNFGLSTSLPLPGLSGAVGLLQVWEISRKGVSWVLRCCLVNKCFYAPSLSPTFSALSAVTLGRVFLTAVQHVCWLWTTLGCSLLLQLGHPPGQPGAQGAGSTSVLTTSFHLQSGNN